jgi:hypothetical protein
MVPDLISDTIDYKLTFFPSCHPCTISDQRTDVCPDTKRPIPDFIRTKEILKIDAQLKRIGIFGGHSPERILDDDGGVIPTPSSRNRTFFPEVLLMNSAYLKKVSCQLPSSTNVSSQRRFIDIGSPHAGQYGTSSSGTRMFSCSSTILMTVSLFSQVFPWHGCEHFGHAGNKSAVVNQYVSVGK